MNNSLESLAAELGLRLQQRGYWLVTAESCTGGGVAQAVTSVAGSSAWFERGFVTYSNLAKQELLGVSETTLETYGAVSEATVLAMVNGAITRSHAHIGVAVSGIAGPTGGTPDKPVGTVWIAYAFPHTVFALLYYFSGDRQSIREQTIIATLQRLLQELEKEH